MVLGGSGSPDRISSLYAQFGPERVRLVVEMQAAAPLYQVYYSPNNNSVVIDIRNVEAATLQVPMLGPDACSSVLQMSS